MSGPTDDPIVEQIRRLVERLWRWVAWGGWPTNRRPGDPTGSVFSKTDSAGHGGDDPVPESMTLRWRPELESLRKIDTTYPTHRRWSSEAFSAFNSESDNEWSTHSNYWSSHDTLDEPDEHGSEHTLTPESVTTILTPPTHEENPEGQTEEENNRTSTPPEPQLEEDDCVPMPPINEPGCQNWNGLQMTTICRTHTPNLGMNQMPEHMYAIVLQI